ncbi:DUF2326 domain-containing protein [Paenibacillus timonensis]|uniref:DUF2326 domain-containing protein n=1 Tax=Paenibacillus timonensis TaxID=225915 RepID=UPI003F99FF11
MRIDKLIVKKTVPSIEIIRNIKFNEKGLSLIVDNTRDILSESGNNVGKTTVIKIIDLCLGAKSVRELYFDQDTRSENEKIRSFLSDYKVQAELVLLDGNNRNIFIKRDLFPRGKRYIGDRSYTEDDFNFELKKIIFEFAEKLPSFRQLITKFIRVSNTSADSMIKFLPGMVTNDTYDAVYSHLFRILGNELVSKKNDLSTQLADCQKAIAMLEKHESISSISVLRQKKEIIEQELNEFYVKRSKVSYIETYKEEMDKKRKLTSRIIELEEQMQFIDFEINTINDSIRKISGEKSNINLSLLEKIYKETKAYFPKLQKQFEDLVSFHNQMIQNRIDFIKQQLFSKQEQLTNHAKEIEVLLDEKKKITVEILDEGLLDELNLLNKKIEELTLKKGEILQLIKLLEEQESIKSNLISQIQEIESMYDENEIENKMRIFNNIFSVYCEKLYGEKYLLAYNNNWKNEKKFPVTIASFGGNVGTGKKKAVIVAFDLAYMKYAKELQISAPQFVIHDKLENTHINQLKTIIEICQDINGQYIIPILRERISEVESKYIEQAKVLELSADDKFFRV